MILMILLVVMLIEFDVVLSENDVRCLLSGLKVCVVVGDIRVIVRKEVLL